MNVSKINNLQQLLSTAKRLAIVMHVNPDGDAIGSALSIYEYATQLEITAIPISPTEINENLLWLPHSEKIFCFDEENPQKLEKLGVFDTVIFVDHSSTGRSGDLPKLLNVSEERSAYIDHHPSPNFQVGIPILDDKSAATCCIAFDLLIAMNATITPSMATCLYTGIVTDTGNFRYGSNIGQVFRIASELVALGIDKDEITQRIFHTNTENRLRLLGFVLKQKMQRVGKHSAYITLTQEEITNCGAIYNDTEDFVNYPLTIKDVFVSAIFIEKKEHIKISFRSRGKFDVNLLARNHFNGGGHKNASGGRFYGTIDEAVALFSKKII